MTKNLQDQLAAKYPKILPDIAADMRKPRTAWGIECSDGWYELLDAGMLELQELADLSGIQIEATQIKEKYGTLSFYFTLKDNKQSNELSVRSSAEHFKAFDVIVERMEENSANTCEVTGKPGKVTELRGWYKTLCEEEATKQGFSTKPWQLETKVKNAKKSLEDSNKNSDISLF